MHVQYRPTKEEAHEGAQRARGRTRDRRRAQLGPRRARRVRPGRMARRTGLRRDQRRQPHRLRTRRTRRRLRHHAARESRDQHRRSSLRLHPGMKGTPMRKLILPIIVLVVALATAAVALGGNDSGSTAQPAAKPAKNIVQTAVAAGDFDTLVSLVKRAGLAKTLSGKGPFTVFAPDRRGLQEGACQHPRGAGAGPRRAAERAPLPRGRRPLPREAGCQAEVDRDAGRPARQGQHPQGHRPRGWRQGRPGRRARLKRCDPRDQSRPDPAAAVAAASSQHRPRAHHGAPGALTWAASSAFRSSDHRSAANESAAPVERGGKMPRRVCPTGLAGAAGARNPRRPRGGARRRSRSAARRRTVRRRTRR